MYSVMPATSASDDCKRRITALASMLPLVERLEIDLNPPAVRRQVDAVDADERRQTLDGRIAQDDRRQRLLPIRERIERRGRRHFGDADDHPGILNREESLRHDDVEQYRRRKRTHEHQERQRLVPQYPSQRYGVSFYPVVEETLGRTRQPALALLGHVPQQPRAHHRCEGQRDDCRHQNRNREGNRKLAEQASDDVAHEEQRNQHSNERHRERHDRESDLVGALQGRSQRRSPAST